MASVNLEDYFCETLIKELQNDIEQKKINIDNLSIHVNECQKCKGSLLQFMKKYLTQGNFFNFIMRLK